MEMPGMLRAWKQREEDGDWNAESEAARRGWFGVTMCAGVGEDGVGGGERVVGMVEVEVEGEGGSRRSA